MPKNTGQHAGRCDLRRRQAPCHRRRDRHMEPAGTVACGADQPCHGSRGAAAALLRRCILEWAVLEAVRTDEGKDYTLAPCSRATRAGYGVTAGKNSPKPLAPSDFFIIPVFVGQASHELTESTWQAFNFQCRRVPDHRDVGRCYPKRRLQGGAFVLRWWCRGE